MPKPRTKDISPNKISATEKKRAERVRTRLQSQGMGRDQAEKEAIKTAVNEKQSGKFGGSNSGGQGKKGSENRGPRRDQNRNR